MRKSILLAVISLALVAVACGGGKKDATGPGPSGGGDAKPDYETFGPLTVGADWESYTKVNSTPSDCQDHGKRLCDFYVNDVGLAAYKDDEAEIPVGAIIVKRSWEKNADGTPGDPGPIFVMEKRGPDYQPELQNWYWAIHWEKAAGRWVGKAPTPLYWQSPSTKLEYCHNKCHLGYDRALGGVPEENRGEDW